MSDAVRVILAVVCAQDESGTFHHFAVGLHRLQCVVWCGRRESRAGMSSRASKSPRIDWSGTDAGLRPPMWETDSPAARDVGVHVW